MTFEKRKCGFAGGAGNTIRFKTNGAYNFTSSIHVGASKAFEFKPDGSNTTVQFNETSGAFFKTKIQPISADPVDLCIDSSGNRFKESKTQMRRKEKRKMVTEEKERIQA